MAPVFPRSIWFRTFALMSIATDITTAMRARGGDRIDALVILGSGMSGCFGDGELAPLFDRGGSAVVGHSGRIGVMERHGASILVSLGRRHLYEGYSSAEVIELVAAAAALGARSLLVTNAAGGLNPRLRAGEIMVIDGCITPMLGRHGVPAGAYGAERGGAPLFIPPDAILASALGRGLRLARGTYAAVTGPSYETRAEIRMLRRLGGDAVGMSTYLEAAEGALRGMRVVGLSLITNVLTDAARVSLDHGDVVEQGRIGADRMRVAIEAALDVLL